MSAAEEPQSLTEIARLANVPLASCSAIMRTLEQRGYATEEVAGRTHFWSPTLATYRLGARLVARLGLGSVAQPYLQRLADELEVPAHAGTLDGNQVVYLAKATGPSFVQFHTYAGRVAPFNVTALGKVIAAFAPPAQLEELMTDLAVGNGPNATRGAAALRRELDRIRADGYAIEDQQDYADIGCVAAPVIDSSGQVTGGISVTGFSADLIERRSKLAVERVRATAAAISGALGAPADAMTLFEDAPPS